MKKLEIHTFDDALQMAMERVTGTQKREIVMLDAALGYSIATDITCQKNLPSFDNSAMDGFALRAEDAGKQLRIVATIFAGDTPKAILEEGCCYKIMTGAQVPSDADTIVPIEECSHVTETEVAIPEDIRQGNAFRPKGEEQKEGNVLFEKGEFITPAHIALLSAQGIMAAKVYKQLQIAVLSTGDEIKEPWEEASEDEIYNANAFAITSLLQKYGFAPTYAGAIPDDLEETVSLIAKLKRYDVIITTGGISMGDADFLEEAFVKNGLSPLFHGVNVKPGRPTMMGTMQQSFVMAMPGNPLTAMINTFLLSLPVLFKMQGSSRYLHDFVYAKNIQAFKMRPGRNNIVLGKMENGTFHVTRNNKYGSGMLTPIVESNALAIFNEEVSSVKEEEFIKVILFESLPLAKENDPIN
jgi:molybdopterin molybdotransferase